MEVAAEAEQGVPTTAAEEATAAAAGCHFREGTVDLMEDAIQELPQPRGHCEPGRCRIP